MPELLNRKSVMLTVFILALAPGLLSAGTAEKRVSAVKAAPGIQVDGVLARGEWPEAGGASDFLQYDPEEGAAPTEVTEVMVAYDENAVYVAFRCKDSDPSGIVSQLTRRDRTVQADRVSVMIDSYHDHTTAYLFGGSVSGVQSDGVLSNDGRVYDVEWDAVWSFAARTGAGGWSAEFRIPLNALRFSESDSEAVWGINFRRYIARKRETDEWVMVPRRETPPGTISSVSRMGHLTGLRGLQPALHVEVLPYIVPKVAYLSQPAPFSLERSVDGSVGVDIKYGLARNGTLDLTFNPDFGQVEVDRALLNLTVFEPFYPEKRPFFLEGSHLFTFGSTFDNDELRMFYSRRIGRALSLPPPPSAGVRFAERPQYASIIGAGKFTGKTASGLSAGALAAVTQRAEGIPEDTSGARGAPVLFEPRSSYNVVRLKQDIAGNSSVGCIASGTFREEAFPSLAGGVDWNIRSGEGEYALDGFLAGSMVSPDPGRRLTGGTGRLGFGRIQAEHWLAASFYDFTSRGFSINDAGLFNSPLEHGGASQIVYKEDRSEGPARRYQLALQMDYRWNWDGAATSKRVAATSSVELRNFWFCGLAWLYDMPAHDDASRGIAGLYLRPWKSTLSASVQTDIRRPLILALGASYSTTRTRMERVTGGADLTLRPAAWLELTPSLSIVRTRLEEAWVIPVYTAGGQNLFGDRDVDETDFSMRGSLTFSSTLSLQAYGQVLLDQGHYAGFRALTGADSFTPYSYPADPNYADPDFSEKSVNADVVLVWEYLPGSRAYFVWTHARHGSSPAFGRSLSDNLDDAFALPSDNVFLAKLTYFWAK